VERPSVGKALQAKLTESVAELVDKRTAEIKTELQAMRTELRETREQLAEAILMLEVRHRRDMFFAGEVRAARESEAFMAEHLVSTRPCPNPEATIRFASELVSVTGPVVKFGVGSGEYLLLLAERLFGRDIVGFDTLAGLPEDWRPGHPAGSDARDKAPQVRGATILTGQYDQTVPGFLAENSDPIALLYLDTAVYGETLQALDLVADRLTAGTIVVLGEYFNYPGWQRGQYKAWAEFVERTGSEFRYEGYTFDNDQVVVSIT
jgi:hypothetical protein